MTRIWCRAAGLVPVLALADSAGLSALAGEHLSVPGDKGANAGLKVASLVAGMVAGADSIDDMALLRHGGMGRVFDRAYAPSTLGSFLRAFTFGHVRQLDAVASRFLTALAHAKPRRSPATGTGGSGAGRRRRHDHRGPRLRQAGRRVRLLRGARPERAAGHRHHRRLGAGGRGAAAAQGLVRAPRAARNGWSPTRSRPSAPCTPHGASRCCGRTRRSTGHATVGAALRGRGRGVGHRARWTPRSRPRSPPSTSDAWTPIEYTDADLRRGHRHVGLPGRGRRGALHRVRLQTKATEQVPGRLVVRRIPDLNAEERIRAGHLVRHLALPRLLHHHRPRRAWTPSPRTRPTAATRSSSRSTPT